MKATQLPGCCGVQVIHDFKDSSYETGEAGTPPEDELASVVEKLRSSSYVPPFVIFTDTVDDARGEALAKYIRKYKLGAVYETNSAYNNDSGNEIVVYIWEPDPDTLEVWEAPEKKVPAPKKLRGGY